MNSELFFIIRWYLFFLLIGWGTFPLSYLIFRNFPDRGFTLTKVQGVFLVSYLVWIATSAGFTQYTRNAVLTILFIYLTLNIALLMYQSKPIFNFVKMHIPLLLLIEGIFGCFFVGYVLIRMYNPELTGAEKEADFTLLNAILHSKAFPPKDTWFVGAYINYYYFGYLIWATVIKVTGIISPVGFNLALATIVALSAVGILGLVYHYTRQLWYGILSAFLLCVLGNLDGFVQLLERRGHLLPFDWWRSSRVIPDTINEFPYFSFLLGDLHAHFMAIPFILLLLGLLSQLTSTSLSSFIGQKKQERLYAWMLLLLIGLSLGGTAVINSWDYPTLLIMTGLCLVISVLPVLRSNLHIKPRFSYILRMLFLLGVLIALSRVLFLPFYQNFTAQLTLSNLRIVSTHQRTEIKYFLIIYGGFLWVIVFFLYDRLTLAFRYLWQTSRKMKLIIGNSLLLIIALRYVVFYTWVLPIAAALTSVFLYLFIKASLLNHRLFENTSSPAPITNHQSPITNFQSSTFNSQSSIPYLLLFMAYAIIAGCEMIYIKDFYGHPLERQNTIFKFYYQAWIFLAVGIPYLLHHIFNRTAYKKLKPYWTGVFVLLFCAGCIYPLAATYEKTNHFHSAQCGGSSYVPTLNGISYIAHRYPDEYEALQWIQQYTNEDVVILEATGKPYSFFGRVATTTGRSTVLGWGNHESLWRDQTWKTIMERTEDIRQMYETGDKSLIRPLLQKYGVNYIYVGTLEQETYKADGLKAFSKYYIPVFKNASVEIFIVNHQTE